jgi:fructose-bisphosphate aldolase class 1
LEMEQPEMNTRELTDTARALAADDKGLLAMDESNPTCNKRFAELGIPQTEQALRAYRELIVTTPGLGWAISGAILYDETIRQGMMLEGLILKPNMVSACPKQESVEEVADATVRCLLRSVPAAVPGIAFLSGGESAELASARLNALNARFNSLMPWALAFSFARAIQQPALEIWRGREDEVLVAQRALSHRAMCNRATRCGEHSAAMEGPPAGIPQLIKPAA